MSEQLLVMSELESFLEHLSGEGESGEFTIDYRAARQNLARHQLGSPLACLQNLVMSAVAAGASELRFAMNSEGVVFEHDGEHPAANQVPNLFTHLFSESESLRHLAIACNYLAEDRGGVLLESQGSCYRFLAEEIQAESGRGSFQVCAGPDFGYRLRAGNVLSEFKRSCRFAPALIYFDGRSLNRPEGCFEEDVAAVLRLYDSEAGGDHFVVAPDFGTGAGWTEAAQKSGSRERATVWLGSERSVLHCQAVLGLTVSQQHSSLCVLRHGVRLKEKPLSDLPGVVVLLGSEGLKLDLSTGSPVEDATFQQRLEWLAGRYHRLISLLRSAYPSIVDHDTLMKAARFGY